MSRNPPFENLNLDVIKCLNQHDLLNRANPNACWAVLTNWLNWPLRRALMPLCLT